MYYIPSKAMPVAIFFSSVINLLYYFGVLQYFLLKVSWFIHKVMQTSPTESVVNIMNIFVGMVNTLKPITQLRETRLIKNIFPFKSEAPLIIKPFLPLMTNSELFAVLTSGYSTVAGSMLAGI